MNDEKQQEEIRDSPSGDPSHDNDTGDTGVSSSYSNMVESTGGQEGEEIPPSKEEVEDLDNTPSELVNDDIIKMFQHVILGDPENAKCIFIAGKRGYGKTYDTNILSNLFQSNGYRVHVVSPITGKISGCHHSVLNSPVSAITKESTELETAYLHCLLDIKEGVKTTLLIDEVDTYCSSHKMHEALKTVMNLGRHLKINIVTNARIPARVHRDITTLYDAVICHYMTGRLNFDYVENITDEEFSYKCFKMSKAIKEIINMNENDPRKYSRCIYVG